MAADSGRCSRQDARLGARGWHGASHPPLRNGRRKCASWGGPPRPTTYFRYFSGLLRGAPRSLGLKYASAMAIMPQLPQLRRNAEWALSRGPLKLRLRSCVKGLLPIPVTGFHPGSRKVDQGGVARVPGCATAPLGWRASASQWLPDSRDLISLPQPAAGGLATRELGFAELESRR